MSHMRVNLPNSDDVLERHQFYAAINANQSAIIDDADRSHASVHRLHERMDSLVIRQQEIHEEISKTETRNKTVAAAVIVAWTMISGAFGWMWDKSSSKIEAYVTKIEQQEKIISDLVRDREKNQAEINSIVVLKRRIETMQKDFDDHVANSEEQFKNVGKVKK